MKFFLGTLCALCGFLFAQPLETAAVKPTADKPTAHKSTAGKTADKTAGKSADKTTAEKPVTEKATAPVKPPAGPPAKIESSELQEFATLPEERKKLIEIALTTALASEWLPYKFGGSEPGDGGFDCSGAMYYVLRKAGLKPPRTSAEQYLWLKENSRLHEIPANTKDLTDASLKLLQPGDLLFWGGTYTPTDGRTVNITHIALFLGHEKKDGLAVMINATDGRTYRGKRGNGFGVYDFHLPRDNSRSVFMGYGTPPGVAEMAK